MNVFIARIAAALASAIVVWLLGAIGVDVTADQQAEIIGHVTQAITLLGLAVWGVGYAVLHKLISRFTNPADTATPSASEGIYIRGNTLR